MNPLSNIPYKLEEEMIYYLYSNNLVSYNNFKAESHIKFNIIPVEISKRLYNKAKFYNIAIQKLLSASTLNQEKSLISIISKYLSSSTETLFLEIANKLIDQYENGSFYMSRPSSLMIIENQFLIDTSKNFIFLSNTNLHPNQIHFSDNQFYNHFSNKYPDYFQQYKDLEMLVYQKTPTSQTSIEIITESIIEAMRLFSSDAEKNEVNNENSKIMKKYNEDVHVIEKEYDDELKKIDNDQELSENVKKEMKEKVKKKEINEPKMVVQASTSISYNDTIILFICSNEKNESNKQEQLSLSEHLYSKQ